MEIVKPEVNYMKKLTEISILFVVAWIFLGSISAQQQRPKDSLITVEPKPCESNNLMLEQANREAGQNSVIILIARLGVKDTKRDISKKRLHTAKAYLVEYGRFRSSDKVITAEAFGTSNLNYGGVEIYVNGKFLDILTSSPNGLLGLGACAYSEAEDEKGKTRNALLYPWLYEKKLK